jgi:exopolysaccharide biosynthesis polyprenyl glycosylphosphotransferase
MQAVDAAAEGAGSVAEDRSSGHRDRGGVGVLAREAGVRDFRTRRLLLAGDLVGLTVGLCSWLVVSAPRAQEHVLWGLFTLPAWVLLFRLYGLYAAGLRRVGYKTVDDIPALGHALLVGTVLLWMYFQATPPGKLRFLDLLLFVAVSLLLILSFRVGLRNLARRTLGAERVMFVGSGPMTPILVRQMLREPRHGLKPLAVLTQPENTHWPLPLPEAGSLAEIDPATVLRAHRIDRVIVSAEGLQDDKLLELVDVCRQLMIKISALPSLSAMIGPAATIDHLEGITLIGINTPTLARSSRIAKRTMDVIGASILLILTLPILIITAIAIKLDTPGPVLFRQNRVGRGGKPFKLTKFRSMSTDAEARRDQLLASSRQHEWLDLEHDPRITRTGRFIRNTSIDELPQLWNVIRGDMSLVGPRPLIEEEDRHIHGWARGRLDLTPGITGLWQVLGRTNIPFEQMITIDYLYVANWSLWTDIKLILQTIPTILRQHGAN